VEKKLEPTKKVTKGAPPVKTCWLEAAAAAPLEPIAEAFEPRELAAYGAVEVSFF
jgi:hypothetical protein